MNTTDPPDPPDSSPPSGPPPAGQPHDSLFKGILGRPENAASELRTILPTELAGRLDLDRLERVDGSFVDEALRQQHTDVLFRTRLDQEDEALVYVLLEHQSTPDHWMALRMASYLIRIWTRHLERHPDIRQLPPIIPIVVYQGRRPWTPPTELTDLITTTGWTPFSYWLDDLHRLNIDELKARPLTPGVRLAFVLMCVAPGNEHLPQHLLDLQSDLLAVLRAELESLWTYALTVSNTPETELTHSSPNSGPKPRKSP